MSSRSAARGKAAANSIRLTSRTSKAVATSRASPSRCFLFCRGSRAARSAPIAVATVAIPPTRKPPQARRVSPITERSSAPGNLMGGKERLVRVLDNLYQLRDMSRSFGHHDAELGQMPAQGIDDLGPLPHQEIAGPEHESGGLGLLAFGSHEAHGRALGGLADRLGIRGIVLLPLDERLDVCRRGQPGPLPPHAQLPRPKKGAAPSPPGGPAGGVGPPKRAD